MTTDIRKDLENLKQRILLLGTTVEQNLGDSLRAVLTRDLSLAEQVMINDREIDEIEVSVEDACLSLLALHQPYARDLRFIVTVLKINIDLERIGDLAVKIAGKVGVLAGGSDISFLKPEIPAEVSTELSAMCDETKQMLKMGLDAFAHKDAELAYTVIREEDKVDISKNRIGSYLEKDLKENPSGHQHLIALLSVSRNLERIADHTTNICENIIYMLQARIIRHRIEEEIEAAPLKH